MKSTKKHILLSSIALLLCFASLLGTTFAWFTDSATSGSNVIKAGTLDIVMEYWNGTEWIDAEGKVLEFQKADNSTDEVLWEPGCTYQLPKFRVRNEGSLAAKILIRLNGITGDEKLMEAIELKNTISNIPDSLLTGSAANVFSRYNNQTIDLLYGTPDGTLIFDWSLMGKGQVSPGTGHTDTSAEFTISGHMKEDAGNEYQGLSIEGISITVIATQETYESDSFGKYYDQKSPFPVVSAPANVPDAPAESITLYAKGMRVNLPGSALPVGTESVAIEYTPPVVNEITKTITYESIELVDQNGEKIDLSSNAEAIAVTLPAQTTFAPGTAVEVYHDGEKIAIASVASDGTISYVTTHFSKVDVTLPKDAYYVATYDEFYTEVYCGGTIIPTADIALSNFLVSPNTSDIYLNGKNITAQTSFLFYAPIESAQLSVNGTGTVTTSTGYVSMVTNGGTFTVNGGTFNLGATNETAHFFTQNSGKTIINGGTFISTDADTPILYCINGFIEINGGFFRNTANPSQALLSMGNNLKYANNQKITLSGGTFVNWNPMDSAFAKPWANPDVPALIVLADGYQVIAETQSNGDVWYTVVPVESVE